MKLQRVAENRQGTPGKAVRRSRRVRPPRRLGSGLEGRRGGLRARRVVRVGVLGSDGTGATTSVG